MDPAATRKRSAAQALDTAPEAPDYFACPLTFELMVEPVVDPTTGTTYEKAAICEWLSKNATSPVSGRPLAMADLVPNSALRGAIETWRKDHIVPAAPACAETPAPVAAWPADEPAVSTEGVSFDTIATPPPKTPRTVWGKGKNRIKIKNVAVAPVAPAPVFAPFAPAPVFAPVTFIPIPLDPHTGLPHWHGHPTRLLNPCQLAQRQCWRDLQKKKQRETAAKKRAMPDWARLDRG